MNIAKSLLLLGAFSLALPALADTAPDARLRDQLRETTLQLRQLQDENASLKASNNSLMQQKGAQPAGVGAAAQGGDADLHALRAKLQKQQALSTELQKKLDAIEPALARWKEGYEQLAVTAKTRDADATRFEARYQQTQASLNACVADNARLVDIGTDLVKRYREKGWWSVLRDSEPVTGISKIRFEKLAQDYRARLVDATVPASAGSEPVP